MLKNIHDANLFQPITLRRLGALSLAVAATTAAAAIVQLVVLRIFVWFWLVELLLFIASIHCVSL